MLLTIILFVCLGVLGKFSTEEDSNMYQIPQNIVFWIPTEDGDKTWYAELLPHLKQLTQ